MTTDCPCPCHGDSEEGASHEDGDCCPALAEADEALAQALADRPPFRDLKRVRDPEILGDLPRYMKEGRCTHRKGPPEPGLLGVLRAIIGPMPELCGDPVAEPDLMGRPSCAKHAEEIRKTTREGRNILGIVTGRHRSH